jgi:cellulose synthase/poly-beta-1,6-N-acetylglucosamine synthase-like glycosyltransferase
VLRRGRFGLGVAALLSALWFGMAAGWFRGSGRVPVLANLRGAGSKLDYYPFVSVVVAARDEREAVEAALRSLLEQDYPGRLEVIAVDDRSTDGTGDIMAGLAAGRSGRLRHLRVDGLPEGWLGKNHALWVGAGEAEGGWLLFTDADVRFGPDCVELAVRHAVNEGLDHLALAPELVSRGTALKSFVAAFVLAFEVTQRPWRVSDSDAKESVGVGAFNLVRREAYEGAGTHEAVRMRPDDDLRLGRALKEAGFRQAVLIFAMLRSTYKTLVRGGIEWRGTFYPLERLRRGP